MALKAGVLLGAILACLAFLIYEAKGADARGMAVTLSRMRRFSPSNQVLLMNIPDLKSYGKPGMTQVTTLPVPEPVKRKPYFFISKDKLQNMLESCLVNYRNENLEAMDHLGKMGDVIPSEETETPFSGGRPLGLNNYYTEEAKRSSIGHKREWMTRLG